MATSMTTGEASALRKHKQRPSAKCVAGSGVLGPAAAAAARPPRDTNKRPRVSSTGTLGYENQQKQNKKTGTTPRGQQAAQPPVQTPGVMYGLERWAAIQRDEKESGVAAELKARFPAMATAVTPADDGGDIDVEDEGGGAVSCGYPPGQDLAAEIASIAAKNDQLQSSVTSLKRKFSLREEETHQLLLGLGALNAVANELAALQKDYQDCSCKNIALIQESLAQISNCSAQVDTLKRSRDLTATQLQNFRQECTHEMSRLVSRLGDLADSGDRRGELEASVDAESCATMRVINENRDQIKRLKDEANEYRAQFAEDGSASCAAVGGAGVASIGGSAVPSCKDSSPTPQQTTERIHAALAQLDELHAEMFQLKQCLVQENQSFRQHLENLVSRQMTHIREVQDNETERIHEEMDDIRSGMCGILKDMHLLKERTKYLVPSTARVGPARFRGDPNNGPPPPGSAFGGMASGEQEMERWTPSPGGNPKTPGYSLTMSSRRCQDVFPHYEHDYNDDCYSPGVSPSRMEARYTYPSQHRSPKSSNSSPRRSDDENWRAFLPPEDAPAAEHRAWQPCESPHYSSRSSSLSDRLSVYGEEHVVPNDEPNEEQFERRLLEQHRLFWIGEGAG